MERRLDWQVEGKSLPGYFVVVMVVVVVVVVLVIWGI